MCKKNTKLKCFLKKLIKKLIVLLQNGVLLHSVVVYHFVLCEYSLLR